MNVNNELKQQSRRDFFTSSASGLGGVALASLLQVMVCLGGMKPTR